MNHLKSFFSALVAGFILTACSSLDISDTRPADVKTIDKSDMQWQQHLKQIKQIQHYSSQGQIGYISSKERFSSRFEWNYSAPTDYTLKLYSTISSTSLVMQMHNTGMTISDNKGNRRSEADAKALVREIVGMDVPLEQFAYWLKGQPDEKADYQVGENHYLASFTYPLDGTVWSADYLNYHEEKQPALPKDILLKNADQTLKIRVDNWTF
ncbi:lipoprotein insertase outer membrane protein LolB [Basfia succiniciproducens]|uniref:lipoprotein insertase outer membrane protein LolB n=1 Tax=Basfia succiniciproducens TaxID=653940 RepID=UPI0008C02DF2|nr:lipoprotein insertase outer membrane protein LolB [Basfia succiniciproducens]SEP84267.1 outer membrane lipoprotein LolB [Basfia succiniciproducens]